MGQYNRLGKRRAGGAWQWLIIGFFPGLLCGGLVVFLLLLAGIFNGFGGEPEVIVETSQPVYIAVTVTPDPNVTQVVQVVTATSEPTDEAEEGAIVPAELTPFNTPVDINSEPTEVTASPTSVPLTAPDASGQSAQATTQGDTQVSTSNIPAELLAVAGNLVQVEGGIFTYGADPLEIVQAAGECQNRDGGNCLPADGDDSNPRVQVELDTFWIEQYEVTFTQYEAFLNYQNSQGSSHLTGCQGFICIQTQNERPNGAVFTFDAANYRIPANYETLRNHPAYGVTWYGAQAYCQALGRRLPTEAEWEYAARAGGQDIVYPWGNNWNPSNANVRQPLISTATNATVPVTDLLAGANILGLAHMSGNVAEWVQDYYLDSYYLTLSNQQQATGQPVLNPTGPAGGTQRVLRGGSFDAYPFYARTVHRQSQFPAPETRDESDYPLWVGFRCASDTGPQSGATTTSGTVSPSSLLPTIPAAGGETNPNAQPTAPVDTENESETGEGARG